MTETAPFSQAVQDYLKAIYKLAEREPSVSPSALAEKLHVAPASVTGMLKKLVALGLVDYARSQGVRLTEDGRMLALEMIRHHRLIELYLQKALGFTWDKVDAEAERLEHHISEEMEAAMAAWLDDPEEDPHGDPIPRKDGSMPEMPHFAPLTEAEAGTQVRVRRVKDSDSALLRYLGELGLYPHTVLEVVERGPFDGPLVVRIGGAAAPRALGQAVTDAVFVEAVPEAPHA